MSVVSPARGHMARVARRARSLHWLGIRQRFRWLLALALLCFACCGAVGLYTLNEVRVQGPVYDRIKLGQDLVADVLPPPVYIAEPYLVAQELVSAGTWVQKEGLVFQLESMQSEYENRLAYWRAAELDAELRHLLLERSDPIVRSFYKTTFTTLIPAVRNFDREGAVTALAQLRKLYLEQRAVVERVVTYTRRHHRAQEESVNEKLDWMMAILAGISSLVVLVFVAAFIMVDRSITAKVNTRGKQPAAHRKAFHSEP